MSEERKANLVVGVDNQTKAPLQEIRQDASATASSVEQSGKRMAKGMEGLGEGAQKSAKGFDGSTRSIIGSIQRATAAIEAGEKGTSKYFETLAKQRNIGGDVLEPYLAQMRKAEAAQAASIKSLGGMEISAKQTAAALRGVPAQFTDIFVSLQGGQAPLTVLLQQGGQLKDMFGGVGAAAKALGGYVLGLVNPYTLAAGAIGALAIAYNQGSKEQDAFVRSIVLTGNASGVTAGQLRAYAREISDVSGTQAKAAEGLAAFAAAGVRGGEELKRYTQTAIEWEKATGQAIEKTAEQFASLQKDPLAAVLKLNDGTNFLTTSVYEQIKALEQQGDKAGAAKVAMDALNSAMKERSAEIKQSLGYIEAAWAGITGAAKKAWDAMLNVGRPATLEDQLVEVQKRLDTALANQSWGETGEGAATGRVNEAYRKQVQENIKALTEQKVALLGKIDAERLNAAAQEESARLTQARTDFDKKYGDALKDQISLQDKLARARKEAEAAGKSEAEITKVLAWVTEEHNKAHKKGDDGRKAAQTSYQSLMVAINQSVAASKNELDVGEKLTESQKLRIKYEQELATRKRAFTAQEKANIESGLLAAEAAERQAQAAKELAKAWEDDVKVYDTHIKKQEALVASIYSSVDKLRLEEEGHMLAASANISHSEAMERLTLARLEEAKAQMLQGAGSEEEIGRINREIAARKELLGLFAQRAAREANKKAADEAAKDWERTSRTISDTLSDYIMSGGKNAAQYLKRLFATLVLQPVVQTVVGGLMGTGVAGASGVASGGVGGVGGLVNSASNLYSMFNSPLLSTNIAAGLSSQIGTLGADLWMNGFESVGNSLIEFSSSIAGAASTINMIGNGLGYVSAIYSLSQGKYGSAIGAGIGTYVGGPIGAVIGSTLGGLVDGLFGGGTVHTGAAGVYTGGKVQASNASTARQPWIDVAYSPGMQASIDSVAGLIGGSLDAIATQLGKKSGYSVKIGYGADNDDPSFGAYNIVNPNGQTLAQYGWATKDFRFDSDPSKGYDQYLKSISQKTLSIMASEFGGWAGDIASSVSGTLDKLSGSDAVSALQTTAQQIMTIVSGFKALGDQMSMFAGISSGVQTKLIKVSGSFDALASNVQSFYANYYSEQEQMDAAVDSLKEVFAKYGAALPATTEQYRALVEQQMAAGEAGAEFAAVLLGLNGTFKQVASAWKTELDDMRDSVSGVFDDLTQGISDLVADVASDRASILRGDRVMTAQEIALAIAGTAVATPSTAQVDAAKAAEYAALAGVNAAKLVADSAGARSSSAYSSLQKATSDAGSVSAQIGALNAAIAERESNRSRRGRAAREAGTAVIRNQRDALAAQLYSMQQEIARLGVAANDAAAQYAAATEQLDGAKQRLEQAQALRDKAMADYAVSTKAMIDDAAKSVTKLSDLRGEVSSFYEAQAQAVQTMLQSAGNLRSVVEQLRLGQLDSAQTAAELSSRYAANYSMALATSGSTRAGYVDAMAGSLPALTDALKAQAVTGEDWRIQTAKLFAQATTAAGLLDGDAKASDYQEVALGLLDSIDGALSELGSAAQSAQDLIVSAIEQGTASNLVGLRAVIAALKGDPIPAFAAGGLHAGGLRIVGEHGPELEATGPARIWNASQTAAMLGGGSINMQRVERLLEQRNEEARAQASAIVRLQQDVNRLLMRWETQGLPEQREVSAT